MAWKLLRTDYVDATFEGLRRYLMSENSDGSVSFHDITNYTVKEDAFFGAKDANTINTAVNAILAALENGTDLYEVFTQFFELQKTLFLEESDAKQEGFEAYITQLRSYMDGKWDELKSEYTGDIQYFKDVQENAFNVWFQMVRDQLTNDVAGHLQTQIGNLDLLETKDKESLVNAANDLQAQIKNLDNLNTTAHSNLTSAINEAKAASGVTGVKGNKESSYRKGEVNITPANIGALPDETVPISKGGTGKTTAREALNNLIPELEDGSSIPTDNDWYLAQYAGGGTNNVTCVKRKMTALWTWIKGKADGTYLSKSGGEMTGSIKYKGTKSTHTMIDFIDNSHDTSGNGIAIGGGGATIIGGGESAAHGKTLISSGGDERLILLNDGSVDIYAGVQNGISGAKHWTFDSAGNTYLPGIIHAPEVNAYVGSSTVFVGAIDRKLDSLRKGAFTGKLLDMYAMRGAVSDGVSIDINFTGEGGFQFLMIVYSKNINTNIFYGATVRLVSLGSSNYKPNVLNLGATSNTGYTITAKDNNILNLKAAANIRVQYEFYPIC